MTKKKYSEWIGQMADFAKRPHYADQTPGSLKLLAQLVRTHQPETIVELGTAHGLSTRLWIEEATEETRIVCIDQDFKMLRSTERILPVDLSRLELVEKWVHDVHLQDYWGGRTLLYVDIHSDHMHVMDAVPDLPPNSIVIFDDVWRSNKRLKTEEEKKEFLEQVVTPEIDYMAFKSIWPLCYGDYWRRGGFWGFGEVSLICNWVAENKITLHWEKGAKVVWFQWPLDKA